jgi:hypothetical protein
MREPNACVAAKGATVASPAAPIQYMAVVFGVADPAVARWLVPTRYCGGASHAHNYQLRDASLDRLDCS